VDEKVFFTEFWTRESKTTCNVLATIPEGSDYRPDPKSRTAREIASQIVWEERMRHRRATRAAGWSGRRRRRRRTMSEVLEAYEQQSAGMARRCNAAPPHWLGGRPRPGDGGHSDSTRIHYVD